MRHKTLVDTFAIQVNFNSKEECDDTHSSLITRLEEYGYLNLDNNGYEMQYKYKTMGTIETGSYSYKKKNREIAPTTWYLQIKLAGLVSYTRWKDEAMMNCLLIIMSYLNTRKILFYPVQLDVALDIYTKYKNVQALCTKRLPKTEYYKANEKQKYDTTRWIEKFKSKQQMDNAAVRAQLYGKTFKHKLSFQVARLEVSFQKNYFKSNQFNVGNILHEFQRYHVNYIPNQKKQQEIRDQYDSKEVLREKDVKELRLELSRLHLDINVLVNFVTRIYMITDDRLDYFLDTIEKK